MMTGLGNVYAVARREYTIRIRTRSFLLGTLILLIGVIAIAFAPIIVRAIDQSSQQDLAVHVAAADLQTDPVATLSKLVNASKTNRSGSVSRWLLTSFSMRFVP